jgi:acyl-CoA synthetase (NDP forming)
VGAVSNAGFETVGIADAIQGQRYRVEMARLGEEDRRLLGAVLEAQGLGGLVNARNPLDITPMANEEVYEGAIRVLLESPDVDAVVVGIVPLTSALKTTSGELAQPGSLAERLPRLFAHTRKPLIAVIDSGSLYDPLARALREGGVPVFRSADQAIRSLGRYLCHRVERRPKGARAGSSDPAPMPEPEPRREPEVASTS